MVWEEAIDKKGQVYYYDTETDKTQWERPAELKNSNVDEILGQFGWETFKTDDGETYYFNTKDERQERVLRQCLSIRKRNIRRNSQLT